MNIQGFSKDFRFGMFELQPRERRLLKAGNIVSLGPRAFDVLTCLVERAGPLVTKEQLFSRVWTKVVVDDSALQVQISSLRKVLGSDVIATVSGQGYRFMLGSRRQCGGELVAAQLPAGLFDLRRSRA